MRRMVVAGLAVPGLTIAGLALAGGAPAMAQFKPTKPIEIVVHNGPGSGPDLFGRAVAQAVEQEKLAPVRMQVSNRVGGGGVTAMNYLLERKGDTHVLAGFTSVWMTNPLVQQAASARVVDMTPIARLVVEPAVIVVRADSPFKTLREVMNAALKEPGKIRQAGGSPLARDALVRQLLMAESGAKWAFVSFPAGSERLAAVLGGHVDFALLEPPEVGELIRAGKLRALVQIAEKRLPGYENVPTLPEAGFKVPNVPQARGIVGPPGMPTEAVGYYEDLLRRMARSPSWQKFLATNQLDDAFLGAADTIAFLGQYESQLRAILVQSGVKLVR
ncbi:MAG: tripartite tricarboxylate transporter substrate binding protein [Hyphomicrobiales bacterium]|nr:tripartite tricarboxylate transporter substrate binding protein [Hyphomicrobiales bacterium]